MSKIFILSAIEFNRNKSDSKLSFVGLNNRSIGWFDSKEKAEYEVLTNGEMIEDSTYNYAVIEEYEEGLYPNLISSSFYKINDQHNYQPINKEELPPEFSACNHFWYYGGESNE